MPMWAPTTTKKLGLFPALLAVCCLSFLSAAAAQDTRSMFAAQNHVSSGGGGTPATRFNSKLHVCNTGASFCANIISSVTAGQLILVAAAWQDNTITGSFSDSCNTGGSSDTFHNLNGGTLTSTLGSFLIAWARVGANTANCNIQITTSAVTAISTATDVVNDSSTGIDISTRQFQSRPGTGTNAVTSGNVSTTHANDYCWSFTGDVSLSGGTLSAGTSPLTYTAHNTETVFPSGEEDGVLASAGTAAGTWTNSGAWTSTLQGTGVICVAPH